MASGREIKKDRLSCGMDMTKIQEIDANVTPKASGRSSCRDEPMIFDPFPGRLQLRDELGFAFPTEVAFCTGAIEHRTRHVDRSSRLIDRVKPNLRDRANSLDDFAYRGAVSASHIVHALCLARSRQSAKIGPPQPDQHEAQFQPNRHSIRIRSPIRSKNARTLAIFNKRSFTRRTATIKSR